MASDFYKRDWDIASTKPLEALGLLNGYYECPKDVSGKRLGPLVGYAGKYTITQGSERGVQKQFVGDIYANFAKAENRPRVYDNWADRMKFDIGSLGLDVVLGMPMGGIAAAFAMSRYNGNGGARFCFAEKKVTAVATETMREQSMLTLGRHELYEGERVGIGEDVVNNLSTTAEAVKLIRASGAEPVAILCWLNCSPTQIYESDGLALPIVSLIWKPFPQYRQDDPEVAEDIARGNVVLKPKNDWPRLMETMETNRPRSVW